MISWSSLPVGTVLQQPDFLSHTVIGREPLETQQVRLWFRRADGSIRPCIVHADAQVPLAFTIAYPMFAVS